MPEKNGSVPVIDYDFHGLVGIRLIDALPSDRKLVHKQFGYWQSTLHREPDITIHFVDQLTISSPLRYVGLDDAGFTDDQFVIFKQLEQQQAKIQLSMQSDQAYQFVCERGLTSIPLLTPIMNLVMVSKGILPLHASAFRFNDMGILTTGWAKGGKTELLMAFAANGASYIGDEWVYLNSDGSTMYGFPLPITLRDWHFAELPQYWKMIGRSVQWRMRTIKLLDRGVLTLAHLLKRTGLLGKIVQQSSSLLQHFHYASVPPEKLFEEQLESMTTGLDKIFFVVSHESSAIVVQPTDPQQIASRMFYSLQYERMYLLANYLKFGFAFPETNEDLLTRISVLEKDLLSKVLVSKEAYTVYHPYPVSLSALFDAVRPYMEAKDHIV